MSCVIHIEDDPLWADYAQATIAGATGFAPMLTARNGAEGLRLCHLHQPRVVILDLRLPDTDGLLLLDRMSEFRPSPRVLIFTARADDALATRLYREPVAGLLWKSRQAGPELLQAVSTIACGGSHYSADAQRMWRLFHQSSTAYVKLLSHTELRLLPRFAEGCSDAEVAALSGCAASTAHTHRKNIMAKLGLHSQVALMRWALAHGVFDPPRAAPPCAAW